MIGFCRGTSVDYRKRDFCWSSSMSPRRTHMSHSNKEDDSSACIMTYSHDGFGLGHLRRNTTIASHLASEVPNSSVLMMIGCPSGAVFKLPPGVDFIKLPSLIKRDTGV